jgi:phosphoserine phosphatase
MFDLLKRQLLETEERLIRASDQKIERIAAFDLDGTLLIGDIGDAVFAYLVLKEHNLKLSWDEYQRLLRTHKSKAYRAVVEAMGGLEIQTVIQATSEVMKLGREYFALGSDRVRSPRPRPLLSEFVSLLHEFRYQVFVISASNHISVQYVAQTWFNIPPSHAYGIQGRIQAGRITSELVEPVPVGSGKAELFKLVSGSKDPLITGTDSRLDLPLLRLTHPQGLSLWVGDDRIDFNAVRENARAGQRFFFVESGEETLSNGF